MQIRTLIQIFNNIGSIGEKTSVRKFIFIKPNREFHTKHGKIDTNQRCNREFDFQKHQKTKIYSNRSQMRCYYSLKWLKNNTICCGGSKWASSKQGTWAAHTNTIGGVGLSVITQLLALQLPMWAAPF